MQSSGGDPNPALPYALSSLGNGSPSPWNFESGTHPAAPPFLFLCARVATTRQKDTVRPDRTSARTPNFYAAASGVALVHCSHSEVRCSEAARQSAAVCSAPNARAGSSTALLALGGRPREAWLSAGVTGLASTTGVRDWRWYGDWRWYATGGVTRWGVANGERRRNAPPGSSGAGAKGAAAVAESRAVAWHAGNEAAPQRRRSAADSCAGKLSCCGKLRERGHGAIRTLDPNGPLRRQRPSPRGNRSLGSMQRASERRLLARHACGSSLGDGFFTACVPVPTVNPADGGNPLPRPLSYSTPIARRGWNAAYACSNI